MSAAAGLILIGIVGLVLPLIPGALLIFIGVAVFLDRNPKILFNEIVTKAKERYHKKYDKK